jgi:hypothetical protein
VSIATRLPRLDVLENDVEAKPRSVGFDRAAISAYEASRVRRLFGVR